MGIGPKIGGGLDIHGPKIGGPSLDIDIHGPQIKNEKKHQVTFTFL